VLIIPGRLRWLWLTLGVVFLDRASKAWFESQTVEGWRYELIQNFAYFVHSRNPGIAFGVLSDSTSPWTRVLLITGFGGGDRRTGLALRGGPHGGRMTAAGLGIAVGRRGG
jgi:hypothetical protein